MLSRRRVGQAGVVNTVCLLARIFVKIPTPRQHVLLKFIKKVTLVYIELYMMIFIQQILHIPFYGNSTDKNLT